MNRIDFQSPHDKEQYASIYFQDKVRPADGRNNVQTETPITNLEYSANGQCRCQTDQDNHRKAGLLETYLHSATIHGISQTSGPQFYIYRRPIWCLLVIAMAIGLSITLFGQISNLYDHPVKTVTRVTLKNEMVFPAVTICSLNQYIRDRVPDIPIIEKLFLYQSQYAPMARGTGLFNKTLDLDNLTDVSGDDLVAIVRHAAPRLEDLLRQCTWEVHGYNCQDLFRPIQTGYGTCFVFNGPDIEPDQLAKAVSSLSMLRVLIWTHNDKSYYSKLIHAGIKVLIHQPDEMPFPLYQGWYVRPGVAASMALSRSDSKGLPSPYKAFNNGYCVDTTAEGYINPLKRYKIYTEDNCINDCLFEKLEALCNCKHYFALGNRPYCSAKQLLGCYIPKLAGLDTTDVQHCGCGKKCHTVTYDADISYADFASDFIEEQAMRDGITFFNHALSDNIVDLKIYFKSLNTMDIVQEPELTSMTIIGTVGGQMGLFLGASILSVTELIELILILVLRPIKTWTFNVFKKWSSTQFLSLTTKQSISPDIPIKPDSASPTMFPIVRISCISSSLFDPLSINPFSEFYAPISPKESFVYN
ncbi:acid-sensing ion channel 1 [Plakobranchus ocellatus]|uniref:Acid-sensing ion channel 1 n=1 Tax=Plakobranchus ocellatus TaxID=259542 RepID=A0AAV3Y6A6_9GAST|nr:acid-sensing ion channel 1 [Plakobranchus ocellatus]